MQPKTDVKFNEQSFNRIKRMIRNMSVTEKERSKNPNYATTLPDEITIQLTNKCNLRCKHCFQWNEDGFFNDMEKDLQNEEIDFNIVEKIYRETSEVRPNMYLWGGETLMYKHWEDLTDLMVKYPRRTIFCTNALLIEKKLDSIIKISENLEMLISIDGFEEENDEIRGKGVYKKIIEAIDLLLDLKAKGIYKGDIVIHNVINDRMVNRLYELMELFEEKGVTSVYFIYPWYLPDETSIRMDDYFGKNFSWLYQMKENEKCSWHAYKYRINPALADDLVKEVNKINERVWKVRIRFQPAVEPEEIHDFILGKELAAQNKSKCLAVSNRMNVMPNGMIVPCKLFPEFATGDLNKESVYEAWNNEKIKKCREIINCGLMPVCSKCVLLYLSGR